MNVWMRINYKSILVSVNWRKCCCYKYVEILGRNFICLSKFKKLVFISSQFRTKEINTKLEFYSELISTV